MSRRKARRRVPLGASGMCAVVALVGCSEPSGPSGVDPRDTAANEPLCTIPLDEIFDGGVGRDGIRSLENPLMVSVDDPNATYLLNEDRVIVVELGDRGYAIPQNILWWHEIVNIDEGGASIAVSFCPLTGSSLAFDRSSLGNAELGVSGLLFRNNLIMFDRESETLFPQMMRLATCGPKKRMPLPQFPAVEMSWAGFRALYPDGLVVSEQTGFGRAYTWYPYGDYADIDNPETLFPQPAHDDRRGPKERVLGVIQGGDGGTVFPYTELELAAVRAVPVQSQQGPGVMFWNRAAAGAAAYLRTMDGQDLDFRVSGDRITDQQTGSTWDLVGRAVAGPLAGNRLTPVLDSYTSFWFSWASFQPETSIWRP